MKGKKENEGAQGLKPGVSRAMQPTAGSKSEARRMQKGQERAQGGLNQQLRTGQSVYTGLDVCMSFTPC